MVNNTIVPGFDDEIEDSLKMTLQKVPELENGLIIILNGYIDTYNSNYFLKRIQKAIDAGYIRLIFHCGSLNYVSSTGIGSFSAFLKSVRPRGGDMILLDIQQTVYEVLQLLDFSTVFNIQDSLENSLRSFRGETIEQASTIFPKIFKCPNCANTLEAAKPGNFRCSECKTIITISNSGGVFLG